MIILLYLLYFHLQVFHYLKKKHCYKLMIDKLIHNFLLISCLYFYMYWVLHLRMILRLVFLLLMYLFYLWIECLETPLFLYLPVFLLVHFFLIIFSYLMKELMLSSLEDLLVLPLLLLLHLELMHIKDVLKNLWIQEFFLN